MSRIKLNRSVQLFLVTMAVISCAVMAERQLNERWGEPEVRDRFVNRTLADDPEFHRDIKPIFDKRCVTCHACYDAPCQLKLSSYEGLDRGASDERVYDGTRILAIEPSRLWVDAKTTQEWRDRAYFPVLNERKQMPESNLYGSLLYRMLELKKRNPLPMTAQLDPDVFDFSTGRNQECPTIESYKSYAAEHPLWGMPFGMPAISEADFNTVERWIELGSPVKQLAPIDQKVQKTVLHWERFFNGTSNKQKLFARYAFEHLYLANIWFESHGNQQYFKLVRSRTPSGKPIDELVSRRPFDDPGTDAFYYRLRQVTSTIVDKTHMPYRFIQARMDDWNEWFFEPSYEVPELPGYDPVIASNPFKTFKHLPVASRYKFMLSEAEYTIMGYIKGPVCRGQVALNVIEDQFWVFFVDPDVPTLLYDPANHATSLEHFTLPASEDSNASPFSIWTKYSELQEQHLKDKLNFINKKSQEGVSISLDMIWNGHGLSSQADEPNNNAALTIFRHFDNATVVKGLQGPKPKTAWVISYSLLERIHYLLVAGFDVFGNVGHQLNTRLYMDFLRMEGESNFLMLLPDGVAEKEFLSWYQGAESQVEEYLELLQKSQIKLDVIEYKTENQKAELFDRLSEHLGDRVLSTHAILPPSLVVRHEGMERHLDSLVNTRGKALAYFPELSVVRVNFNDQHKHAFTIALNRYHKNVSSLLLEEERLLPERYSLSLYPGVLGSYPNTFYDIDVEDFGAFVEQVQSIQSEKDYVVLLDNYAVRRTNPLFWAFSDWLNQWYAENQPGNAGIIDLNRFENR